MVASFVLTCELIAGVVSFVKASTVACFSEEVKGEGGGAAACPRILERSSEEGDVHVRVHLGTREAASFIISRGGVRLALYEARQAAAAAVRRRVPRSVRPVDATRRPLKRQQDLVSQQQSVQLPVAVMAARQARRGHPARGQRQDAARSEHPASTHQPGSGCIDD